MKLTDIGIRALQPPASGAQIHYDDTLPGFGVRISEGGTKSFILTHGARRHRETIGRVGIVGLQEARAEAKRRLAEYTLGKTRPRAISWSTAVSQYLTEVEARCRKSTHTEYARLLTKYFRFGDTRMSEIGTNDLHRDLDKIEGSELFHAYTTLRSFIRWAYRKHFIDKNPMDRMQPPGPSKPRERVLTDHELKKVWVAAGDIETYGVIVRCLMVSGQRRSEIAKLAPGMVADDTVTIPPSLTKNKIEHTFPTGPLLRSLLPKTNAPLLFPVYTKKGFKPFSAWSKSKKALDKASGVYGWVLHDLRRTLRTRWADPLGISEEVAEMYINHLSGTRGGIKRVYNLARYLQPMRDAVEKWEQYLVQLLA